MNKGREGSEGELKAERKKRKGRTGSEDAPKKSRGKGGKDVYPDGRENGKERKRIGRGFKACRAWK